MTALSWGFTIFICLYLFLVGACCASFLLVVVHRTITPGSLPFFKGRSHWDACGAVLTARDLVPVFSWIVHKGRCRHCGQPLSPLYPISELIGGLAAAWAFAAYPLSPGKLALCLLAGAFLLLIGLYDGLTMEIPDLYTLLLCLPAVLSVWIFPEISLTSRIIGLFVISLPLLIITLIIPGAFGGGDIQLMAVCGFMLGWQNTLVAFMIALLLACGQAIVLFATGRAQPGQRQHMPFGPALCAGSYLALLFGTPIVQWYLSFFPA